MAEKKNLGGRPPKYISGEALQTKIDEYFARTPEYDQNGNLIRDNHPTFTGLALYLGFLDRRSLYNYIETGRFSHIIKKAQARVAESYENYLVHETIKPTGPIFALKNAGWSDQRQVEHTGDIKHTHSIPAAALEMLEKIKRND